MLLLLGGIWEATVGSTEGNVAVCTTWTEGNVWALHLLDGADARKNPEVRVAYPREFF
jgi:hypothetical protein